MNQEIVYRYTSAGEGVFSIGKRLIPNNLLAEVIEAKKWIPKPNLPEGKYCFYLTEKGCERYEKTLLNSHKKYLKDIHKETKKISELKKIVYRDEWQVVEFLD